MYQERWANARGKYCAKFQFLSVTSAARFSSVNGPQIWHQVKPL
ncbi:Uncharacterized protein APZ42_031166 [Daphnia magna]|uniref:Uncharacterized protein n=1 Tax=Daphnia magna TaxID=35525 RepID=A0A164N470_9CRUS|nr:Uncharacterized protein APZ42_031166 [Daphnia magna]